MLGIFNISKVVYNANKEQKYNTKKMNRKNNHANHNNHSYVDIVSHSLIAISRFCLLRAHRHLFEIDFQGESKFGNCSPKLWRYM